jgi:hypothetical protein
VPTAGEVDAVDALESLKQLLDPLVVSPFSVNSDDGPRVDRDGNARFR